MGACYAGICSLRDRKAILAHTHIHTEGAWGSCKVKEPCDVRGLWSPPEPTDIPVIAEFPLTVKGGALGTLK